MLKIESVENGISIAMLIKKNVIVLGPLLLAANRVQVSAASYNQSGYNLFVTKK
jgi:hypothetical protein